MPLSVLESIADVLHDRLSAMVADPVTYPIEVSEVIRPTRYGGFTPLDKQIVLTEGPERPIPELSCPGSPPAVAFERIFNIRCHALPSERDTEGIDVVLNEFAANVKKCVCQPASSWHTFGGYAIKADWGDFQPFISDGGIEGINMPIRITYRVSENDPYTQR